MTEPAAPQNVRIETPDGTVIPLRVLRGPDEDGMTVWLAYGPPGQIVPKRSQIRVGLLPAHSRLHVQVEHGPTGHLFFTKQPLPHQRGTSR